MDTMKVLIIGGAGYVGSKLFEDLSKSHDVGTIDLEWFGKAVYAEKNSHANYNILSEVSLMSYDVVILLAAYASVSLCAHNEQKSLENDVINFRNLFQRLNIVSKSRRIKFIYASSGSVYGSQEEICSETNSKIQAVSFYDLCKRFNDEYALIHESLVEFYGLRFGTVNGYSSHLRTDIMINAMYYNSKFKSSISCSCPDQYRGILDIADLSRTIQTIIKEPKDKRGIYNVVSFNANIGTIAKRVGKRLKCQIIEGNAVTPYNFKLSCEKLMEAFPLLELNGSIDTIMDSLAKRPFYTSIRNIS